MQSYGEHREAILLRVAVLSNIGSGGLALLFASCCAWPIVFVILGAGGAWLGIFDVFYSYRIWFFSLAILLNLIVWGWIARRIKNGQGVKRITKKALFASFMTISGIAIAENQGLIIRHLFQLKHFLEQ